MKLNISFIFIFFANTNPAILKSPIEILNKHVILRILFQFYWDAFVYGVFICQASVNIRAYPTKREYTKGERENVSIMWRRRKGNLNSCIESY